MKTKLLSNGCEIKDNRHLGLGFYISNSTIGDNVSLAYTSSVGFFLNISGCHLTKLGIRNLKDQLEKGYKILEEIEEHFDL